MPLLAALLIALFVLVSPAAGATTGHCGSIGPEGADTGLYNITAQQISCRKTRRILTRWYNDPDAPKSGPAGWSCKTLKKSRYKYRTTCRHGHLRIGFTQFTA